MSRSQARVSLPSISIPQNILQDQPLLGFVISDLTALIACWDDIVDDLLSCTDAKAPDVRNLWVEAIMSIEAFRRVWIEPLQQKIQGTFFGAVSGVGSRNVLASIKGRQPALKQRYDLPRPIQSSINHDGVLEIRSKKISYRLLIGILAEAVLRTRMAVEKSHFKVLESLPQGRASGAKSPLQSPVLPLPARKWLQLHSPSTNKRRDSGALRIGYPACVSVVLPWGKNALTGSSRLKLGRLSSLQVYLGSDEGYLDLHTWFRGVRQDRFDSKEQKIIDTLVMGEINAQRQEFDRLKLPRPSQKSKSKITVMSNTEATRGSLKYMVVSASSRIPSLLATAFGNASAYHLGQSYDGQSLVVKRECPVCTGSYVFPVSHTPSTPHDFDRVAEADKSLPKDARRGACAEAIEFIQSIVALGLLRDLGRELELTQSRRTSRRTDSSSASVVWISGYPGFECI